jgi:hypothetical protein
MDRFHQTTDFGLIHDLHPKYSLKMLDTKKQGKYEAPPLCHSLLVEAE